MNCESCKVVGIKTEATTTRNGESVCDDCAQEIDEREAEAATVRQDIYDGRGVRRV